MRLKSTAVPALLFAPLCAAQTELYFGEYQFQAARISAVSPDGSNPHVLFPLPAAQWLPLGLTFNPVAERIIWIDSAGASELLSANLDGSAPVTITTPPGFARGVGRDSSGRLYFSTNNTVRRVDADGGNPVIIFTSPTPDPVGNPEVDATNAHVYIGADGEILRMDLDGSNIKTVVRGISQPRAIGLDIAAGFIYWIDADTISDYVGRARLDDTGFTVLIDNTPGTVGSSGLIDLLVDPVSAKLFYADEFTVDIRRANLDGSGVTPIYTSPAGLAPSGSRSAPATRRNRSRTATATASATTSTSRRAPPIATTTGCPIPARSIHVPRASSSSTRAPTPPATPGAPSASPVSGRSSSPLMSRRRGGASARSPSTASPRTTPTAPASPCGSSPTTAAASAPTRRPTSHPRSSTSASTRPT